MSDPKHEHDREDGDGHDAVEFAAPPFDMVVDVCGDPSADLALFMAGNQYMALPDLVARYQDTYPSHSSVFYETLPPGVLEAQLRTGCLRMGSLELRVHPDVIASSPAALTALEGEGLVGSPRSFASNDLALLVSAGNPLGISGWSDLGREGVRVTFPDPLTEGIGRLACQALEATGGIGLRRQLELKRHDTNELVLTSIHHRQGPAWLEAGSTDVAVVWSTEARHHLGRGAPFEVVDIPAAHNRRGEYAAAIVTGARHPEAARRFVDLLCGPTGRAIYAAHGFGPPGHRPGIPTY